MFVDERGQSISLEELRNGDLIFISHKESTGSYRFFVRFENGNIHTYHPKAGILEFACSSSVSIQKVDSLNANFIKRVAHDDSGLLRNFLKDLFDENTKLQNRLFRIEKNLSELIS